MISLISNCPHNLLRYNYLEIKKNSFFYSKSSSCKKEVSLIYAEIKGLNFYKKKLFEKIIFCQSYSKKYLKLSVKKVSGKIVNAEMGYAKNILYINRVIEYFEYLYGINKNFSHGDVSFANLIFQPSKVILIDWEHFTQNKLIFGFDIVYFLFENIYYEMKYKKYISEHVISDLLKKKIFLLNNKMVSNAFKKNTLLTLVKEMKNKRILWKVDKSNFHNKFPILKMSKQQIKYIDKKLNENL